MQPLGVRGRIFVVEGRDINRAVKAADMVSDHIALGVDEDEELFQVEAEDDTDDVHLELDEETRKLHIQLDGIEYTLALVDPDTIRLLVAIHPMPVLSDPMLAVRAQTALGCQTPGFLPRDLVGYCRN